MESYRFLHRYFPAKDMVLQTQASAKSGEGCETADGRGPKTNRQRSTNICICCMYVYVDDMFLKGGRRRLAVSFWFSMSRRPALQICTSSSSEGEEETEANPPSAAAAAAAAASRISIIELLPSAEAENEAVAEDDDAQLLGPPPIYSSSVPSPSLASLPQASSSSSSYSFSASLPHLSSSSPPPPPYASLGSLLHSRGVKPSSEWISECVKNLSESLRFPGTSFFQLPLSEQAQLCFSAFLFSDLNAMGNPSLPSRLHSLHATELVGPFILQVKPVIPDIFSLAPFKI